MKHNTKTKGSSMTSFCSSIPLFLVLFLCGFTSVNGQVHTCDGEVLEDKTSDACYVMGDRARTWSDSREYCRERGGTLSTFITDAQSRLFDEYHDGDSLWSGLYIRDSRLVNDTSATPEPVRVDYSVWDLTDTFSAPEDYCVRMSRTVCEDGNDNCQEDVYLYNFHPCEAELKFICEIPIITFFSLGDTDVGPGLGGLKFSIAETLDYDMYISNTFASKQGSDLACLNDDPSGKTHSITQPVDSAALEVIARTRVLFEVGIGGLSDDTLLWINNGEEGECFAYSLGVSGLGNYQSVTRAYVFNWPCDEQLRVLCQIPKSYPDFHVPEARAIISHELIRQVNQDVLAHSDVIRRVGGLFDYYGEDGGEDYPSGDDPLLDVNSQSLFIVCDVPFLSLRQSTTLYREGAVMNRYAGLSFYEVRDLIYYFDLIISPNEQQVYDIINSAQTFSCDVNDLPRNELINSNTLFLRPTDYEIYSIHFRMDKELSMLNWTDTLLMSLMETLPFENSNDGLESVDFPPPELELTRQKRQAEPQLMFEELFGEITNYFSDNGLGYGLKPLIVRDKTESSEAEIVAYAYKTVNGSDPYVFTDISKSSDGLTELQQWAGSAPALAVLSEVGVVSMQVKSIDWCWAKQIEDSVTNRVYDLPDTRAPAVWESAEICAGDNKPLVTVECAGNKRDGFDWAPLEVNPLCDYSDSDDEPSEITENLQQLSQDVINSTNVGETIEELDNIVESTDPADITPTDVNYIADVIQKATSTGDLDPDTVEEILKIADEVGDLSTDVLVDAQNLGNSNNRLLSAVDSLGGDLDLGQNDMQTVIYGGLALAVYDLGEVGTNVVLGLKLLSGGEADTITTDSLVSQYSGQEIVYDGTDAAIYLPEDFIRSYADDYYNGNTSLVRLVFNVYKDTALYRYPESNQTTSNTQTLNSHVVAAQLLVNGTQVTELGNYRVRSVFQPLNVEAEEEDRPNITVCVYWDFTANDDTGGWRQDGCSYNRTADGRDVCECDHLTNFAVLVTYYDQDALEHEEILGYISIVGLTLSIVCLACTMLSFLCIKKLRKTLPQQVLFQLCLALILSWIIFLAGIESTSNEEACIAVAALLHYFILASFMWMLVEGILQYLLFVRVMNSYFPNFLLKVTIVSWVVPAIIVGIICAIDYKHYDGGDDYCWMDNTAFYYGFAIPVGLILLTNLCVFAMVTISLCRRRDMSKHSTQQVNQTLVNIRASFFSFVLLGLAWIFGFLAIEEAQLVFQYLFCIFATLQGVVMFVMMTLRDKQVRQYWKAVFSRCCSCVSPPDASTTASSNSKSGLQDRYHIPRVQHTRNSHSTTFTSGGNSDRKVSLDNAVMMSAPEEAKFSARNGSTDDEGAHQLVTPEPQPTDDNDQQLDDLAEAWPEQVSPTLPDDGEIVIGTDGFHFPHP